MNAASSGPADPEAGSASRSGRVTSGRSPRWCAGKLEVLGGLGGRLSWARVFDLIVDLEHPALARRRQFLLELAGDLLKGRTCSGFDLSTRTRAGPKRPWIRRSRILGGEGSFGDGAVDHRLWSPCRDQYPFRICRVLGDVHETRALRDRCAALSALSIFAKEICSMCRRSG